MNYLLLLICTLLLSCQSNQESAKAEPPAVPVRATKASVKDVPIYIESIGHLRPSVFMEVKPEVDGTLEKIHVVEGQWVQKGDLLMTLDTKPFVLKLAEQEAKLAIDRAKWQAAQKKLERFKTLASKELISQNEWEQLESECLQAKSALNLDEATMNLEKLNHEHCRIISAASGRVGKLDLHPGQLVLRGDAKPLAQLSCIDPLTLEFSVTEKEFMKLSDETTHLVIQLLSSPEISFSGDITFSDNQFDTKSGQILLRATVANEQYLLRPGMSVRIRVPIGMHANAKLITQKAVKYNQQGSHLLLVQADNTVASRQVVVGEAHGDEVMVLQGLESEDFVITDGHQRASIGTKVEVKE